MKYALVLAALFALIGFVGISRAEDPKPKEAKPKVGHFIKVENNVLTYKGGAKGKGTEHTVKIDDKTKVTIDGKEGKITDIKVDEYIDVTIDKAKEVATLVAASSVPPVKPTTRPSEK